MQFHYKKKTGPAATEVHLAIHRVTTKRSDALLSHFDALIVAL